MSIGEKSTGELIDSLVTTSHRLWDAQNQIKALPDAEAGKLAKTMLALNSTRNELMREISKRIDGTDNGARKSYA